MSNNPLIEKSDELTHLVYQLTKDFPKDELYGVVSQLRRAALSVPLNIIEGFARKGRRDCRQFLHIAYGSLKETKYLIYSSRYIGRSARYFSFKEGFLCEDDYRKALNLCEEVGKILWVSIKTVEKKITK